jgi:hypothetical protein
MKPDETTFEKIGNAYFTPPVVVSIANDKTGKHVEKIDGKISVVDDLVKRTRGMSFENVKANYHDSSYASQPVKYKIMWFCS